MIEFSCNNCGRSLKVPDERAGAKGRCPTCKAILVVPKAAEPVRAVEGERCRSPELNSLYDYIVGQSGLELAEHCVVEGDKLALEIITENQRRQRISVFMFDDSDLGSCLCAVSPIGNLEKEDLAEAILRAAYFAVGVKVCLSPDGLILALVEQPVTIFKPTEFTALIKKVALLADRLEDSLFSWDAF
jgi:DNA-directed RNA polymerase subunit RPC12/RpoP